MVGWVAVVVLADQEEAEQGVKNLTGKGLKAQQAAAVAALAKKQGDRSAEIPAVSTPGNPYSQQAEQEEVVFLQGKNQS